MSICAMSRIFFVPAPVKVAVNRTELVAECRVRSAAAEGPSLDEEVCAIRYRAVRTKMDHSNARRCLAVSPLGRLRAKQSVIELRPAYCQRQAVGRICVVPLRRNRISTTTNWTTQSREEIHGEGGLSRL
jgi:hypothetical protein